MSPTSVLCPEVPALTRGLTFLLLPNGPRGSAVTLLERKAILPGMTFPAEIVTCRAGERGKLRLFCKHEAGHNHNAYGHRGGLAYEAEVYRRVLQPFEVCAPKFYGAYNDARGGGLCLVLGYLEGGALLRDLHLDVKLKPQPTPMGLAARWIGHFHALGEARLTSKPAAFLNQHDVEYYRGWALRTAEFAKPLSGRFPWLKELCARASQLLEPLVTGPRTIIHGEYYENNIIVRGRRIYPTDWESAAIAAGEIDLASLTEGKWKPELVRQCLAEYQRARWPEGAPADFAPRLEAARLYLHFRWLGERPDWATREKNLWRYKALAATAKRLGLFGMPILLPAPCHPARLTRNGARRWGRAARPSGRDKSRKRSRPRR